MVLLKWVESLLSSSPGERRKLKNTVLNGIRHFNAKWNRTGKPKRDKSRDSLDAGYTLDKTHPDGENLFKQLKSSEVEFIGFVPDVTYIKETGPRKQLEVIWKHDFGTPGLLYKHKRLPLLLIAGPSIRFNKSVLAEIDANKQQGLLSGITG